ncbi:hypothetical protein ACSVDM_00955 [Nocardia sp. JW2]|uniref:hypothetical protein n=1 Tax=Nocardia sp. JW2 TaxID=3450738 RepID=UPI003F442F67
MQNRPLLTFMSSPGGGHGRIDPGTRKSHTRPVDPDSRAQDDPPRADRHCPREHQEPELEVLEGDFHIEPRCAAAPDQHRGYQRDRETARYRPRQRHTEGNDGGRGDPIGDPTHDFGRVRTVRWNGQKQCDHKEICCLPASSTTPAPQPRRRPDEQGNDRDLDR